MCYRFYERQIKIYFQQTPESFISIALKNLHKHAKSTFGTNVRVDQRFLNKSKFDREVIENISSIFEQWMKLFNDFSYEIFKLILHWCANESLLTQTQYRQSRYFGFKTTVKKYFSTKQQY